MILILVRMLENLSLKSKYYDRNISFKLEKSFMRSHFVISFPSPDMNNKDGSDVKLPNNSGNNNSNNIEDEEWGDKSTSRDYLLQSSISAQIKTQEPAGLNVGNGNKNRLKYV